MAKPRHQIPGQIVLPLKMYEDLREMADFAYDTATTAEAPLVEKELRKVDEHVLHQHFPKYAIWPGLGKVRVFEYIGNGRFRVLDREDRKRIVHRDHITFLPKKRKKR